MVGASRGGGSEEGGKEILDGLEKREMTSFLTISLSLVTSRCRDEPSYENLRKARAMVLEQRPMLLVGSPMCTAFSAWQHINNKKRDPFYSDARVH